MISVHKCHHPGPFHSRFPLFSAKLPPSRNDSFLAPPSLQLPPIAPGSSAHTELPMISLQNLPPPGTPLSNTLQVAIKNNQQPVWYFADKLPLQAVFLEDGRIERGQFLETWKSLPDSNEVSAFLFKAI